MIQRIIDTHKKRYGRQTISR